MKAVARVRGRSLIAAAVGLVLALGATAPAWADSNDDLVAVDSRLGDAVTVFSDVYQDSSASNEDVTAAAETFSKAAGTAQTDFQSVADKSDGQVAAFAAQFATEAGDMSKAAADIADAFKAQDSAALTAAETALGTAVNAYDKSVGEYNTYLKTVGDPAYIGWLILLIVAVVLLVLALLFALLTRKQTGLTAAKADRKGNLRQSSLKRLRWMVVLWAAVFVVGAAIPFFQVAFAQPDASGNYTYRVFWYPLAAGAILTVVGVVQYFVAASQVRKNGSADPIGAPVATPDQGAPGVGYAPVDGQPPLAPPAGQPYAGQPYAPAPPQAPGYQAQSPVYEAPTAPEAPVDGSPSAPQAPSEPDGRVHGPAER